jgi:sugar phosphate isomerase/epimerase
MSAVKIFAFADEVDSNIDRQILAMKRNGLAGLEIRGVDGTNVSAINIDKAKEVRRKLDDNGLSVGSVGSPIGKINICDNFDAHLDTYKHTLELASILGAKNLRLFSFYMPKNEASDAYRQCVIDRMGVFLEIAHGTDVTLCHENEKGIYGDIASRCLDLHTAFPELRAVFDPANFVQCAEDTLNAWEMLKEHTEYLHIKDALLDGSVVPAGAGQGNVPFIVRDYLLRGGKALTIEPHLTVFDGLKELEEASDASIIGKYAYPSAEEAFDVACNALKNILLKV